MEEWATPRQGTPSCSPKNGFRLMLDARCLMLDTGGPFPGFRAPSNRGVKPLLQFISVPAKPDPFANFALFARFLFQVLSIAITIIQPLAFNL